MNINLIFVIFITLSIFLLLISGINDLKIQKAYGIDYNDIYDKENDKVEAYSEFKFDDLDNGGNETFNFATAGDFSCSEQAKETAANIVNKEPELVLTLGDHSYNHTAGCWFNVMSALKHKIMITMGYHDTNNKSVMDIYLKSFEMDKPYYSFDYKKVHFLVVASELPYHKGSEQYTFVKKDLKEASESEDVNWIIVSTYGPLYTGPSKHEAYELLRYLYHPLFDKYRVDLVLQAHNHNYQRTYPITFNPDNSSEPVIRDSSQSKYLKYFGTIFFTVGTGGKSTYPFLGEYPFMAKQFNGFGFLNVDVINANSYSRLTGTFFDNNGYLVKDYFTIEKEIE